MSSASKRSLPTRISTPSTASIGKCLMHNCELPAKMFLSFTAAGRNWSESERNDSALRPMFNGRSAAANGAEKSFTPEREAFLIFSREKDNTLFEVQNRIPVFCAE